MDRPSQVNFPGEIGAGLGAVLASALAFYIVRSVIGMATTVKNRYVDVLPYTLASSSTPLQIIRQDVNRYGSKAIPLLPSENERSGIEFSYGFFLWVDKNTFSGEAGLKNIFYKGLDTKPWPLLAPGVFMKSDTNTLVIALNSYVDAFHTVEVENMPIDKWVHILLNFQKNALEVHVNGRIADKLLFTDTVPYLNYENLTFFSNYNLTITRPNSEAIMFKGSISGKVSNVIYTRYALSFNEIQKQLSKGPSKITVSDSDSANITLSDSWWANQK